MTRAQLFKLFNTLIVVLLLSSCSGTQSTLVDPNNKFNNRIYSIEVLDHQKACSVSEDCVTVPTNCSCGCGEPVNIDYKDQLLAEYQRVCSSYTGPMCGMACVAVMPECIDNKCVFSWENF